MTILEAPLTLPLSSEDIVINGTPETGYFDRVNYKYITRKIGELLDPLLTLRGYEETLQWQQAQMVGDIGVNRFVEIYPGIGEPERIAFRGIVKHLAFSTARLSKIDPYIPAMAHLNEDSLNYLLDDLTERVRASSLVPQTKGS